MSGFKIFKKYGEGSSFRKSITTNQKNDIFRKLDKSDWSSNNNKVPRGEPPKYRTFMDDITSRDRGSPKKLRDLNSSINKSKITIENTEISKHNDIVYIDTKEINKNLSLSDHINSQKEKEKPKKVSEINFTDSWYNDEEIEKLKNGIDINYQTNKNVNEILSSSHKNQDSYNAINDVDEIDWLDDNYDFANLEIDSQCNNIKSNKKKKNKDEDLHSALMKNKIDSSLYKDIKNEFSKNNYKVKEIIDMIKFDEKSYEKTKRKFTKKLRQINLLINARNSGKKLSSDQNLKLKSISIINIVLKNISYYEDLM